MRARREPKNKVKKKGIPKKPQHVFFHVFAQTTHVVAAPHGFACVVIPATRLYIPSFIEIRSGVLEPRGVKIWPFPLLWLVAFTTACTTVQAVMKWHWIAIFVSPYTQVFIFKPQHPKLSVPLLLL